MALKNNGNASDEIMSQTQLINLTLTLKEEQDLFVRAVRTQVGMISDHVDRITTCEENFNAKYDEIIDKMRIAAYEGAAAQIQANNDAVSREKDKMAQAFKGLYKDITQTKTQIFDEIEADRRQFFTWHGKLKPFAFWGMMALNVILELIHLFRK